MKVALFSGSNTTPSARFRIRPHIQLLTEHGIYICDYPSLHGQYPSAGIFRRLFWGASELISRSKDIIRAKGADIYIVQKEMLATLYTLERFIAQPKIFDFDDAVYLRQRFHSVDKILSTFDGVFCGNNVLAEYASKFNKNVFVQNTAVDTSRFVPATRVDKDDIVIGWCGSSSNYKDLYKIEDALIDVLRSNKQVKLLVSSNVPPKFSKIPKDKIKYVAWSPENEVSVYQEMDIGLMPLEDNPWNRGKCAYKMLLYMACGIPAVVSPVGMNAEALEKGEIGFSAKNHKDWVNALIMLAGDSKLRNELGVCGRKVALERYSSTVISTQIADAIFKIYNGA
ncbi:Glycosyl transferases group 1 [Pelotomaculum sp. FP]|uniref:glycosyltransferase family 4 protein n=1 Tax=Pelotomaculum sp. FP TaxID=261474 RepID=UPI001066F754|nr:glycosyltransferase family 4 protein [Pelotomaculum sp. FP]TEB14253.1 Glycosyl transferases group 1 [Pelotomaculum sp. FP]